jgi:hypothetical protein
MKYKGKESARRDIKWGELGLITKPSIEQMNTQEKDYAESAVK